MSIAAKAKTNHSTGVFILALAIFGLFLSSCQPWMQAEAYIGDDGFLYLTIPNREKYKSVNVNSLYIHRLQDGKPNPDGEYWSFHKSRAPNSKSNQFCDLNELPLRYGTELPCTKTEIYPKEIINGVYVITGIAEMVTENERFSMRFTGKFIYEDGQIK
ncbi:MAG: hypothetical protein HQM04_11155 [Magnetococcales bacterium]|nr:hypothetical protein [Magnetococcales bacterium]MBF0115581.1 hypothetical protein [Magnetococcales bacterium]